MNDQETDRFGQERLANVYVIGALIRLVTDELGQMIVRDKATCAPRCKGWIARLSAVESELSDWVIKQKEQR